MAIMAIYGADFYSFGQRTLFSIICPVQDADLHYSTNELVSKLRPLKDNSRRHFSQIFIFSGKRMDRLRFAFLAFPEGQVCQMIVDE